MRQQIVTALLAATLLGACATDPGGNVNHGAAAPVGTFVGLNRPVGVGNDIVVTAGAVFEDSRCPVGVPCVWAGRVVVTTHIDEPAGRDTVNLVAGERRDIGGNAVLLMEVTPAPVADQPIAAGDYRFRYAMHVVT